MSHFRRGMQNEQQHGVIQGRLQHIHNSAACPLTPAVSPQQAPDLGGKILTKLLPIITIIIIMANVIQSTP
ncbi:hypothetical protein NQZ68_035365, partial [Dissostichus eleginoides]